MGINVVALAAFILATFLFRRWRWSALVLAAAQVGTVLFSFVASVAINAGINAGWVVFGAAPAVATLVLILQLLRTETTSPSPTSSLSRPGPAQDRLDRSD